MTFFSFLPLNSIHALSPPPISLSILPQLLTKGILIIIMATAASLSAEVIRTVKATSPVLAARGTEITTVFYHLMFSQYPEVRPGWGRGRRLFSLSMPLTAFLALTFPSLWLSSPIDPGSIVLQPEESGAWSGKSSAHLRKARREEGDGIWGL